MTIVRTFDFYTDPGHGWMKVPKALLAALGIADKISPYSYQRGEFAFLEEDGDMSALITAAKVANVEVKWRTHCTDRRSKVRGYESYLPPDSAQAPFRPQVQSAWLRSLSKKTE